MKPGDLVRIKADHVRMEDWEQFSGKIGMIVSEGAALGPKSVLFDVLIGGERVAAFEYELENLSCS